MVVRGVLTIVAVVGVLCAALAPSASGAQDSCGPGAGSVDCVVGGGGARPGDPGGGGSPGGGPDGPIRYLHTTVVAVVGECWYWSRVPGGLDAWDPANDSFVIAILHGLPRCPQSVRRRAPVSPVSRAWEIVRSFPLGMPRIGLSPAGAGVAGLPTFVSVPAPVPIRHTEPLPDGRQLTVEAWAPSASVDWGDGSVATHSLRALRGRPGGASHTYEHKTCSVRERETLLSGGLCHPALDAYSVQVVVHWRSRYNVGSGWIDLDIIDRVGEVRYDVDEVVALLIP